MGAHTFLERVTDRPTIQLILRVLSYLALCCYDFQIDVYYSCYCPAFSTPCPPLTPIGTEGLRDGPLMDGGGRGEAGPYPHTCTQTGTQGSKLVYLNQFGWGPTPVTPTPPHPRPSPHAAKLVTPTEAGKHSDHFHMCLWFPFKKK